MLLKEIDGLRLAVFHQHEVLLAQRRHWLVLALGHHHIDCHGTRVGLDHRHLSIGNWHVSRHCGLCMKSYQAATTGGRNREKSAYAHKSPSLNWISLYLGQRRRNRVTSN